MFENSEYILFDDNDFTKKKWNYNFGAILEISKPGIHVGSKSGNMLSRWIFGGL